MTALLGSPELIRYCRSEAKPRRLLAGFVTATLVGFGLYLVATQSYDVGKTLIGSILWLQCVVLLIYGAIRTLGSVMGERAARTWDFQRLTPLAASELTVGKLLGAPVFAYFLFATLLPWVIVGLAHTHAMTWTQLARRYTILAGVAFGVLSLGLLGSAYSQRGRDGSTVTGAVVLGFFGLQYVHLLFLSPVFWDGARSNFFYGYGLPSDLFASASVAVFGLWALAGAKWRIGQDLQEPDRGWRLPAFLIFAYAYAFGLQAQPKTPSAGVLVRMFNPYHLLWLPQALVYMATLTSSFGVDQLRRWRLSETWQDARDRAPIWLWGLASLILLALVSAWLGAREPTPTSAEHLERFLVLIPAFACRDLAFLQWCRLGRFRRPDTVAVVYLVLAYLLPTIVLQAFRASAWYGWVMPWVSDAPTLLADAFPALVEAALMSTLLWTRVRQLDALQAPAESALSVSS